MHQIQSCIISIVMCLSIPSINAKTVKTKGKIGYGYRYTPFNLISEISDATKV